MRDPVLYLSGEHVEKDAWLGSDFHQLVRQLPASDDHLGFKLIGAPRAATGTFGCGKQ
jgi:hypothetical protein